MVEPRASGARGALGAFQRRRTGRLDRAPAPLDARRAADDTVPCTLDQRVRPCEPLRVACGTARVPPLDLRPTQNVAAFELNYSLALSNNTDALRAAHHTPESKMATEDLENTEWERSKISPQDINLLKDQQERRRASLPRRRKLSNPSNGVRNHDTTSPLPPLPEGGDVEERAVVTDDNQGTSRLESEVAGSRKSAASSEKEIETEATKSTRSSLPAASPKNKRKRDDIVDSGTSESGAARAKGPAPDAGKRAFDPYEAALISSGDEDEDTPIDATARTSTSRTLVVSESRPDGDETSPPQQNIEQPPPVESPRASSPKRARVEPSKEPIQFPGSSLTPSLDDPLMKEFIRLGTQFVGYRDHTNKLEGDLAEANKGADALAAKLEQSEKARKKAEEDAKKAKEDAATVGELRKRLHDAETSLRRTGQEYELEGAEGDQLLDALSLLEIHCDEAAMASTEAKIGHGGFSILFQEEGSTATFVALAKFQFSRKPWTPTSPRGLKVGVEDMSQIVPKCLAKMAKRKRNFGKYDDIVTPVAEDMMDELLRMDAEFFVEGQLC
ncbi:hypothetical protein QYE76_049965 [Lolium multiflorum]|uniref:Uncharacterized protein n=1 Tax=Lolium multiflorum TaxID=4521 RepID=A0AAD8SQU7_LOLMU|nr:hypothetical protein QYE76_049965 [Lolium multiflorum]